MMHRLSLVVLTVGVLCVQAQGETAVVRDSVYSAALGRMCFFQVLLPSDYRDTQQYPVLYLLHGLAGGYTDWTVRVPLRTMAEPYGVIIVMPGAGDSWYVNSATNRNDLYEDFLVQDLTQYIERKYPADTSRRAIAGLSMGGYGAVRLALRHTGRFALAGGFSSALSFPRDLDSLGFYQASGFLESSLNAAFGSLRGEALAQYDVLALAGQASAQNAPFIFLETGIQDAYTRFLEAHRELVTIFSRRGVTYEYHEVPGGHTWTFWESSMRHFLRVLGERLKAGPSAP